MAAIFFIAGVYGHHNAGYAYVKSTGSRATEHGTSFEWIEEPAQVTWPGSIARDRIFPVTKNRKQGPSNSSSLSEARGIPTNLHQAAGRDQSAEGAMEEIPGQDIRGVRGPADKVPGADRNAQRSLTQGWRGLHGGQEDPTGGCKRDGREHGDNPSTRSTNRTCSNSSEDYGVYFEVTEEKDRTRRKGCTGEKTQAGRPCGIRRRADGRRDRENGPRKFSLGRYTSPDDRCIARPQFVDLVDIYFYDEEVPLTQSLYLTRFQEPLNEGISTPTKRHRGEAEGSSGYYNSDQAAYAALLMEYEAALDEDLSQELHPTSSFHEDFWDEVLTMLDGQEISHLPFEFHHGRDPVQHSANEQPSDQVCHRGPEQEFPKNRVTARTEAGNNWEHISGSVETKYHNFDIVELRGKNSALDETYGNLESNDDESGLVGKRLGSSSSWNKCHEQSLKEFRIQDIHSLVDLNHDAGKNYITVETYGFFKSEDRGRRRVAVPTESIPYCFHLLREAWSDYNSRTASILKIDPQPEEATLHLMMFDDSAWERNFATGDTVDEDYEGSDRPEQAGETARQCSSKLISQQRRDYSASLEHYTVFQTKAGTDYFLAETFVGSYKSHDATNRCIESRALSNQDEVATVSCRLLDEWNRDTNVQNHAEMAEQAADTNGQNPEDPMLIIDAWEELQVLLEGHK